MPALHILKAISILTGIIIVGEALALLVGMHFLSPRGNPWISFKNDLLIGIDIAAGIGLVYVVVANTDFSAGLFFILIGVSLLAHGYREWEYFSDVSAKFCINLPLFILNNIKLAGLLAGTAMALAMR